MGREERRKLEKKGYSKEEATKRDALNKPCTILEAIQLSRSVVDDAFTEYKATAVPLTISHSLHLQIMKDVLIKAGLITEEDFEESYKKAAEDYNAQKLKYEMEAKEAEEKMKESNSDSKIVKFEEKK